MSHDEFYDNGDDIEVIREKNLKEQNDFLASFMNDPLFAETMKELHSNEDKNKKVKRAPKKQKTGDSTFRFTGSVPREKRISARLQNKKPEYSYQDLPDDRPVQSQDPDWLVDDLEEVVYQVKSKRQSASRGELAKIIPVEDVTEKMLQEIQTSGIKVYGDAGTSCHQCRQKTIDTKTSCRSGFCVGVRGQFCGTCVINRYGEDPVKALKDPNWRCYVCRGCCNCSFCRRKEGKRPTGILAPLAKNSGYNSVMEFLCSLKGFGDYTNPKEDPENLLGFEGNKAVLGGGKRTPLTCDYDEENVQI